MLQRQQGSYILTVEAGRQLLLSADSCAEVDLQAELSNIQEQWKHASSHLEEQKKALIMLLKVKSFRSTRTVPIPQMSPTKYIAKIHLEPLFVSNTGLGEM